MRDERVFISSVMNGFGPQREAAKAAVTLLGMRPVMAEDFPAKSHSSQQACLEGVRQSNIMVLVLGMRYGFVAESGVSVTEEEFDEARKRGIPILTFLEKGDREPAQQDFINRLRSYEKGYHMPSFTDPGGLKDKIVQALSEHIAGGKAALNSESAKSALDRCKWGARGERDRGPWLGGVILPTRQQQYISPIKLGEKSFQRNVQKEAVYGDAAILDSEHGVKVDETENSTVFIQAVDRGPQGSLEVRTDGTLIYGKLLSTAKPRTISIVRSFVIDQDEVETTLANFFKFAAAFYASLDESRMLTSFFFGGSLSGIEHKSFGHVPAVAPNGMSMASHGFSDPLSIPREPHILSRPDLVDGKRAATEITELVARMFRAAKAYYTAD